ncbi:MAG: hypothetical protein AMJ59_05545 [Gammaproteobacteria bacterium SG8_31]|nr:MAG: hypothetical protein AMJ59_05545 [Gammaproteobacteria bacterium SG8_31]
MNTARENKLLRCFRNGLVTIVAGFLGACATGPSTPTTGTEAQGENGFTIQEDIRVSGDVSRDFDAALQLLEQERYQEAIDLLRGVTEAAPDATAAYINLGVAYGRIADLTQAESNIKRALEINPGHPVAHNELGMIYRRTGRFEAARQSYETALSLHPDFHYARLNLAILCDIYIADLECALENYELYREAVPDDEEASMWIADLRHRVGR